jgi:phosphoribosyl-AMP cyclohydrolase
MTTEQFPDWLAQVHFDEQGLVPAIAQDANTGTVLMVAWMNAQALEQTLSTGQAVYYSRSRQRLWPKGESSGHVQRVTQIRLDCDGDVILLKVEQLGGIACHTGRESCFYRQLVDNDGTIGWQSVEAVLKDPKDIYK